MAHTIKLVLYCGLLVSGDGDDLKSEYARFEGVWRFAHVEVDGKTQPDAPFETNKLIMWKDGKYVVVQGERITRGIIKLDPTQSPKHYDVAITSGPAKGLTYSGLYEIEGDTYKTCLPLRGTERPAVLESKPGGGCLFHVFKREKQTVNEALIAVGRKELAGKWQASTYALDGKTMSEEELKTVELVIDAEGKATAFNEGKVFIAGTTKIDLSADPMTIDVTYTDGDPKGKTALGIYKLEDDILTICRSAPDKSRPTEFTSTPGSGHTLMSYKKAKAVAK